MDEAPSLPPHRRLTYGLFLSAAALRLWLVLRPVEALDALLVPDDTWFTLAVARSLARGLGPTVDGHTLTNGFQALQAFALVPFALFGLDGDALFRANCFVLLGADLASLWLLARLARRHGGAVAGCLALALGVASPVLVKNAYSGLETPVALALVLGAFDALPGLLRDPTPRRAWCFGLVSGAALLARVDAVLALAPLWIVYLNHRNYRAIARSMATTALTLGPWWAYQLHRFGTVTPESGAAVRALVLDHRLHGQSRSAEVLWALGQTAGHLVCDWPALMHSPTLGFSGGRALGLAVGLALVLAALAAMRRAGAVSPHRSTFRALQCALGLYLAFYAFYLPAPWFLRRYLSVAEALVALAVSVSLGQRWAALSPRRLGLGLGALVLVTGLQSQHLWLSAPRESLDGGLVGAKGYRAPAHGILRHLPPNAVVASMQSGALAYWAGALRRDVQVVNLDGVVDGAAARAFSSQTLGAYARQRGVTHLVDWPYNLDVMRARWGAPLPPLRFLGRARRQGAERMQLYALTGPTE